MGLNIYLEEEEMRGGGENIRSKKESEIYAPAAGTGSS